MPAIYQQYSDELLKEFDYLSTWLPNAHVEIGDVGHLFRDRFERLTTLHDLGLGFETRDRERGVDLDYSSGANIAVSGSPGVDAGVASARITVSFARKHGLVFQAASCRVSEVADPGALGDAIMALAIRGLWPADQVVITEVISTGPTVVLVSQQRDASIDVDAGAVGLIAALPLASASAELKVLSAKGIAVKVIAPDGLTPLFRVSGVRRRLFSDTTFGRRGSSASAPLSADESLVFSELTYTDVGV